MQNMLWKAQVYDATLKSNYIMPQMNNFRQEQAAVKGRTEHNNFKFWI